MKVARFFVALCLSASLALAPASALTPAQSIAIMSGAPAWVPKGASFAANFGTTCGVYVLGKSIYGQALMSAFSIWSTPSHYATTSTGILVLVPANTPDCTAGGNLGQLIEAARTNRLIYSKQFGNAAWVTGGATIVPDAALAPDGSLSAALLQEDSASGEHLVYQSNSATGTNAVSIYAKYAGRFLVVRVDPSASAFAVFDLQNGLVTSLKAGVATITPMANGWYLCSLVTSVTGNVVFKLSATGSVTNAAAGGQADYTGNGVSGAYLWQADRQAGNFVTSPIVTTSVPVTRARSSIVAADGTPIASAMQLGKAIYAETYGVGGGTNTRIVSFAGNAYAGFAYSTAVRLNNATDSADATIGASGTYASLVKAAFGMDVTGFTAKANGGVQTTQASAWTGNTGNVRFFDNDAGTGSLNGYGGIVAAGPTKGQFDYKAIAP